MTEFSQNSTGVITPLIITPDFQITYNDLHCSVYSNPIDGYTMPVENIYSLDLCLAGRCELWLEGDHDFVMNPGNIGLGSVSNMPTRFYYPLNYYRGIKVFFHTRIFERPEFQELTDGFSWAPFAKRLEKSSIIYPPNEELNAVIQSLENYSGEKDLSLFRLRLMEMFLLLGRMDIPEDTSFTHLSRQQNEVARKAHDLLVAHPEAPYKVQDIAEDLGVSVSSLNSYYRACYGYPIPTWMRKYRLNLASEELETTDRTIADIATSVGYTNISKFSAAFRKQFYMLPSAYRRFHA